MRMNKIPEKPRLLGILKDAGFDVPDFLFMSGEDFDQGNFNKLKDFLDHSCSSFKVIVRSAHPLEDRKEKSEDFFQFFKKFFDFLFSVVMHWSDTD